MAFVTAGRLVGSNDSSSFLALIASATGTGPCLGIPALDVPVAATSTAVDDDDASMGSLYFRPLL